MRTTTLMGAGFVLLFAAGCGGQSETPRPDPISPNQTVREGRPKGTVRKDAIPILRTVLKPSPHYRVDDEVGVDGYYYVFTVHSSFGDEEVRSVRELIKTLHEIEVIEEYKQTHEGSHVWEGMKQSAKGVGRGLANLVRHPGQSVKRAGKGVGRVFGALGAPFRRKPSTTASDGTNRALLGAGPGGGERRLLAAEVGLDVYTDNPHAQAFIKGVAGQRMMGKLPIGSAVFAMPGGILFTLSLTPMGYDPNTEELIRDNGPGELRNRLAARYQQHFGLDYGQPGDLRHLLDNPNFSPREQAYILRYLLDMKGVGGLDHAMDFLSRVNSPAYAKIVIAQIEMLALVHKRGKRFQTFVPVRNTLGALATDGTLCFLISIDTVRYWSDVKTSIEAAVAAGRRVGARRVEIWSTGDIDARSVAEAQRYGVSVRQNILEDPAFRRPRAGTRQLTPPTRTARQPDRAPAKDPAPRSAADRRAQRNPITGETRDKAYSAIPSPDPVRLSPGSEPHPSSPPLPQERGTRAPAPAPARREPESKTEEALPQLY